MGFVNREFEESEARIYNIRGEGVIDLQRGTIDAERDIRLVDYNSEQLEFGNPDNKYYEFIFDWKGHVITTVLQRVWVKRKKSLHLLRREIPWRFLSDRKAVLKKVKFRLPWRTELSRLL